MLAQNQRDTTAMLGTRPSARPAHERAARAELPPSRRDRHFSATVLNSGRRIHLPLSAPILVGRQDARRDHFPELDLNHDGGYDSGVSRRHAQIEIVEAVTYVEDLGSANGSFINDQRLQPNTPYRLQPGDELRFGSLILRIEQV